MALLRFLLLFLPGGLFATLGVVVLSGIERKVRPSVRSLPRPIASQALLSIAVWIVAMIGLVGVFDLSEGPAQYAGDDWASQFFLSQRVGAVFLLLGSPLVLGQLGALRVARHRRWRPGWFVASLVAYGLATLVLVANPWFLPSV